MTSFFILISGRKKQPKKPCLPTRRREVPRRTLTGQRREEPRRTPMGPRREGPRRIPMGQKRDLAAHARGLTQMMRATIMARKWTTLSTLSRRRE